MCCASGLRIVALARPRGKTSFGQLHFDLVILIVLTLKGIEGEFIVRIGVGHALFELRGDVVARMERQSAALGGEDLQSSIASLGLAGLAHALDKVLVVERK